ncbi:TPA: hypothetical protein VEO38_003806 [Providencia alcalifaciens]|nr:hypothetical protein [Providencia alcalifaciens]HEQ1860207.1 hypothetical protein [Providencia alcalifaciens]
MAKSQGTISIENKWNETIKKVEIIYKSNEDEYDKAFVTYNLPNNQTFDDAFDISYSSTGKSEWIGKITTNNGVKWSSGSFLACNANKAENCQIVVSFNGNNKEMTIYYPRFNTCSKKMSPV